MATETEKTIREQAEEFAALPRAERRAAYPNLEKPVKLMARKIIEGRRGVAYRSEGGIPVFTVEEYTRQIMQRTQKVNDMQRREAATKANIAELKAQLLENYGQEALDEVENALESLGNE